MNDDKEKNWFKEWWMNASAATFGTILGIVLTVGLTYWQQIKNQEEMTRKIAKITFHNIDVRVSSLRKQTEFLFQKDSIFGMLQWHMPDSLEVLGEDSLNKSISLLLTENFQAHDTKSEEIFSSSFEVWQYLEDEKVIGRISACYSALEIQEGLFGKILENIMKNHRKCKVRALEKGLPFFGYEFSNMLLSDPEVKAAYLDLGYLSLIYSVLDTVEELNNVNKKTLGITQEELDELSNLLNDDRNGVDYHSTR